MTDHWRAYAEFLPETIHTLSKAETFTVEGYNSILRHFLARLRRKTKCYTKSLEMLKYSVILLMEPIPKLRVMSQYLEFGIINKPYDAENGFEILVDVE